MEEFRLFRSCGFLAVPTFEESEEYMYIICSGCFLFRPIFKKNRSPGCSIPVSAWAYELVHQKSDLTRFQLNARLIILLVLIIMLKV